jgi:hypothetical protein
MPPKIEKFDINNISTRDRIFLAFTLIAALSYFFYEFEYKKTKAMEKKLALEISNINAPLELMQKSLLDVSVRDPENKIKQLEANIDKLHDDIKEMKAALHGKSLDVLNGLQASANRTGVIVKNIDIKEKDIKRGDVDIKELSLILILNSDYKSLRNFMASLKDFPLAVGVKSMETKRDEEISPLVETRLFLKLFLL